MTKRKIYWITSEFFIQVDLPILPSLASLYDINWCIYYKDVNKFEDNALREFAKLNQINQILIHNPFSRFNPRSIKQHIRMFRMSKELSPDLIFINTVTFPYIGLLLPLFVKNQKTIFSMHHGAIHNGMQFKNLYKVFIKYLCYCYDNFMYYSQSQEKYFPVKRKGKNINIIPLALNDFGRTYKKPPEDKIHFFNFGHIIKTKNIGILIKAACQLYEEIGNRFHVTIVGNCSTWDKTYQPIIRYPEIFTLDIRSIRDEEIPDLFCSNHYLVLPYSAITQSGPLRIAYGYNTPVIASDLEGFKESIVDGTTGILFKNNDIQSLKQTMKNLILNPDTHKSLKAKQREYIDKNLSVQSIIRKYSQMFDRL